MRYSQKTLDTVETAWKTNRKDLLINNQPKILTKNISPRLITTYGVQWNDVKSVLQKHWSVLTRSPLLNDIVGPSPQMVARRAEILKHTSSFGTY